MWPRRLSASRVQPELGRSLKRFVISRLHGDDRGLSRVHLYLFHSDLSGQDGERCDATAARTAADATREAADANPPS